MATTSRAFRFGLLVSEAASASGWRELARGVEGEGWSTLLLPDVIMPVLSPLTGLAVAAATTTSLRVGTWVLANDFRNPVLVAREAATLDLLSDGRFELGLGAGRSDYSYPALGLTPGTGGRRVDRLAESAAIIRRLFRGETVTSDGPHHPVREATLYPPGPRPIPIAIAAGGRRAVELAGREADTIVISSLQSDHMTTQLEWLAGAAGDRLPRIERAARFFALPEDGAGRREIVDRMAVLGLDLEDRLAKGAPNIVAGTPEAIAEQLLERRERFGLSYVVVGEECREALSPVVERLAGR